MRKHRISICRRGKESKVTLSLRSINDDDSVLGKEHIMLRRKRKHAIEVEHLGPLRKHWLYHGRIRSAFLKSTPDHLQVEIVNLNPRELDQLHTADLTLPARPRNRTHALLVAGATPDGITTI